MPTPTCSSRRRAPRAHSPPPPSPPAHHNPLSSSVHPSSNTFPAGVKGGGGSRLPRRRPLRSRPLLPSDLRRALATRTDPPPSKKNKRRKAHRALPRGIEPGLLMRGSRSAARKSTSPENFKSRVLLIFCVPPVDLPVGARICTHRTRAPKWSFLQGPFLPSFGRFLHMYNSA